MRRLRDSASRNRSHRRPPATPACIGQRAITPAFRISICMPCGVGVRRTRRRGNGVDGASTERVDGAIDVARDAFAIRFDGSHECVRVRFAPVARRAEVARVCAILRKSIRNRHVGTLPRKKFFCPRGGHGRRPAATPARHRARSARTRDVPECTSAQKRKLHLFGQARKWPTALQPA